jgi:GR25 family glycosyltransferase involved in LPS biosynthesis
MNNIDHIFYINLDKRKDRLAEINDEFERMGISATHAPERFTAIETPGFGILGCGMSHYEVLRLAKIRGYKNILILEDDFTFLIDAPAFDKEVRQIFENGVDFDVVMFAYNLGVAEEPDNAKSPFLRRVFSASTASCYLVNGHYFDTLIDLYTFSIPLLESTQKHWEYANDAVWKGLMERDKWYITNTRCGKQRASFSDNSNEFMDYGC